jgi:hypothetical protein
LGAYWKEWFDPVLGTPSSGLYVVLTLVKATYIVMTFMHLGDERRNIRAIILLPYALFILYLAFIAIWESNYVQIRLGEPSEMRSATSRAVSGRSRPWRHWPSSSWGFSPSSRPWLGLVKHRFTFLSYYGPKEPVAR